MATLATTERAERSGRLVDGRGEMGCGTSAQGAATSGGRMQVAGRGVGAAKVDEQEIDDGDQPLQHSLDAGLSERRSLGQCTSGRVHTRHYLASRFGNPYLGSRTASGDDFTFAHCPLPRLSQPAAQLAQLTAKRTLADGEILPPHNRSVAGSASANWLDLPARWQQEQQWPAPPLVRQPKSVDDLRADAVNTWIAKR